MITEAENRDAERDTDESVKKRDRGSWLLLIVPISIIALALWSATPSLIGGLAKIYYGMCVTIGIYGLCSVVTFIPMGTGELQVNLGWGPWCARLKIGRVTVRWGIFPIGCASSSPDAPSSTVSRSLLWSTLSVLLAYACVALLLHESPKVLLAAAFHDFAHRPAIADITLVMAIRDYFVISTLIGSCLYILFIPLLIAANRTKPEPNENGPEAS